MRTLGEVGRYQPELAEWRMNICCMEGVNVQTVYGAGLGLDFLHIVMAGLDPAIHVLLRRTKNVDARDKPGHDEELCMPRVS